MRLLKKENVQILDKATDWREAIRVATRPLEKGGYVEECYKEGIIANVEEYGPYIVIAQDIALPHARPEQGTIESQVAITLFRENIFFEGREVTARLFITLAAKDNDRHLEALMQISELLADEDNVEKILSAADVDTLYQYFESI